MKLKNSQIASARIEMLPLIDIVFLLLVFFIYAMLSMAVHRGLPVDLPQSGSTVLETQESISITIQTAGQGIQIFVDKQPVVLEQMVTALQAIRDEKQNETKIDVQIFADKSISYEELFRVMDRVQQAGLTRISLQAEQETTEP
jgi:biopolymer transport protein ExbD